MKQWTSDDGLISNNLTSVRQTDDGFIWITCDNGVHRFDGASFKLYDKENVEFLKTNAFNDVSSDAHGVLLASQGSGVIMYLDGKLTPVSAFPVSSVRKILVDSQNRYWCGTQSEGLYMLTLDTVMRVDHEAFEQVAILDIHEDSKGRIWFATEGNGLVKYEDHEYEWFTTDNLLADNTVTSILESLDGNMIIGTLNGVYSLDEEHTVATVLPETEDIYINDVVQDTTGMLWIGTERGLLRTDLRSGYFELFDESKGLPSNQVSSIMIDKEASVWLTTKKSGLIRLSIGSVFTLGKSDGITSTRISIIDEHDGRIYVGSDDGSIFILEGKNTRSLNLSTKERQVGIRDFMFDEGVLWVASYLGLHQYAKGKEKIFTTEDGLSSSLIRRILKTNDGSTWLASQSGGVMKLENNKVTKVYDTSNGLESNFVLALAEDKQGNLVVGTHSGGISIISNDTVQTYLPDVRGLVIFNVFVDDNNRYWLSTSIGVFVFVDKVFRRLQFDTSFKTESLFDFVPDEVGNIWLPTNVGIIRIHQKQLDAFVDGTISKVGGSLFDENDGMNIRECTDATRSILISSGSVWVPTLDGIAIIDPYQIQYNKNIPQIAITSFMSDGIMISDGEAIEPGKLRYEFEYASTSFLAADRVRFKYQLSGVDDDWISTSERKIEYTNLAPGDYEFSVTGSNNDGVWNETGDKLIFSIKSFYYQTWWFRILIGLMALLISYLIFILRVRRVKAVNIELIKLNEELDRFVYSASHDIRAPLTSIMGVASIARASKSIEEKDNCLDMINESAIKLDGFVRDIIDYSRNQRMEVVLETINVEAELNSILESIRFLDTKGKLKYSVKTLIPEFTADVRRLRVILKNIISNAFLYYDPAKTNPYLSITCAESKSNLKIEIADNGLGMSTETVKNIFVMFYRGQKDSKGSGLGMYIAKENIDKLNGSIKVDSKFGDGTTFTITIPKADDE
ncbi:MAG: hypothetical protein GY816_20475 [Cytophagales bacterium]|nr:hypothetical protein [Cytophagales bacterium]